MLLKLGIDLTELQMNEIMEELDVDNNQAVDIDEFVAYLSLAESIKFKNPNSKSVLVNIRKAR